MRTSVLCLVAVLTAWPALASSHEDDPQAPAVPAAPPTWVTSFDGQLFATFNRQGGPRGETEFRSTNWLMGMASRPLGRGTFTISGMVTGEPLTV
ncbi:MAG TPA: hypothetical protein VGJ29_19720, partial [Vicinamibacterales bacterium]